MSVDRWFRALLRFLPFDFRSDYGAEMEQVFLEQRRTSRGLSSRIRLWTSTIAAILAVGPREHFAQLRQDVTYAFRGMRRNPGFVTVAALTLALGIGANTAIFSVVYAVMLRPLPYPDPDRLVAVWNRWTGSPAAALSDPEYLDYAEQSRTLAIAAGATTNVNVSGGGEPERVSGLEISVNTFDVLGVQPALGRSFRPEEERAGTNRVVLISDAFWRRRFAADPAIVGQAVLVDGVPHHVLGVMPRATPMPQEFGLNASADVLLPLTLDRAAPRNRRGGHYLQAFARLRPGASRAAASAEMDGMVRRLIAQYPDQHNQGGFGISVVPLGDDLLGASRPILAMLSGAVGLVLLLACANVANLMLARGESRRRELAVRTALGASRLRVARQLLTESCALAILGSAAGLAVAGWSTRLVVTLGAPSLPRLADVGLNGPVLLFAAVLALVTGVLFGIVPAIQVSRVDVGDCLKDGARSATEGSRTRIRQALVVAQVSIAVVLLVAASLLLKSFVRLMRVPSGLDPDRVLTLRVSLPEARYPSQSDVTAFVASLLERIERLPGVRHAGAGSGLPLAIGSGDWSFDIEGRLRVNGRRPGAADWFAVTPGYFEALGIPLVRGRVPAAADTSGAAPVIVINETAARGIFPGQDPIGRRIRLSRTTGAEQPWRTIAGVVADVRQRGLDTPPRPEMYIPHAQFQHFAAGVQARSMSVVIKTGTEPAALVSLVRAELRTLDPEVPAARVADMRQVLSASVADRRLNVLLFGGFGGLALALAAIGLYGVVAYNVTARTREMGVRLAIGATRASVRSMVLGQALRLVAFGIAVGVVAALLAGGALARLLYDVGPHDVTIFIAVPACLLLAGGLASYVPARRATQVDPVVALRSS